MNSTPFVRQYGILLTNGVLFYGKRDTEQEIHRRSDDKRVAAWERIYLEEGPEGLYIERRGRRSKGHPAKKLNPEVEEDLLAEVQRLRAENAYLKKLNALVAERVRQERKQK